MGGIFGSAPGTATTGQTNNSTTGPASWMQNIGQGMANTGNAGFNQTFGQAQSMAGAAPGMAAQGGANMNAGAGMIGGAYNQAQSSSTYNPNTFQSQFMNPYVQNVAQQNALLGQRDFNQQTAPSLMGQMGASGQFGSGRADQALGMAATQNQQNINNTNAQTMSQGFQNSMANYQGEQNIGVQGANAMGQQGAATGNLGNTQVNAANALNSQPGNVFGQYSTAMHNLPQQTNTSGTSSGTTPVQGTGLIQL